MERGINLSEAIPAGYDPKKAINYLLAIGIDEYEHWEKLHNAVKDANDFIDVLVRQYQFEEQNVFRLFNREATEDNIREKIRAIRRRITPADNLIIYYSGHGHYDEEFDEGHWVPYDARKDRAGRYISNSDIIKWINALDAQHILLVIDSCFSGSLVVRKRSDTLDEHYRSRRIVSSGRLEAVSDGQPGVNSPFAEGMITYLKKNTSQTLNTTELVQRVKAYVAGKSRQSPVEGRVQNSADENGEFVFHLKVSEAGYWASVRRIDTAKAYEDYLSYYPSGSHVAEAERRLDALREDGYWENAKAKDSELGYESYLKKYAGVGKYLDEARQRLEALHARQAERREWLRQLSQKDAEREALQRDFQDNIRQAEALFEQKKLEEARDAYRRALQYHLEGFAPTYEYIEAQIGLCANGIAFLGYYQDGKRAMERGNFRLALQYFNEALKNGDDPRVEDYIKVCRQRLERPAPPPLQEEEPIRPPRERDQEQRFTYHKPLPPPPGKRAGTPRWMWIVGGLGLLLVVILLAIGEFSTDEPYLSDEEAFLTTPPSDENDAAPGAASAPAVAPQASAPPGYAGAILGAWQVTDMQSNGVSLRQLGPEYQQMLDLMRYTYTFLANGAVLVAGAGLSEYYAYRIDGQLITMQSFSFFSNGTIDELSERRMRITFYSTDEYGNVVPWTMVFRRG
jgi:hypothetical protein